VEVVDLIFSFATTLAWSNFLTLTISSSPLPPTLQVLLTFFALSATFGFYYYFYSIKRRAKAAATRSAHYDIVDNQVRYTFYLELALTRIHLNEPDPQPLTHTNPTP
jgi:hypothetical protein